MKSNHLYEVQLPVFEGPLDLLLQLIEREELDITKVALAKVTDQYIQHMKGLSEKDLGEVTSFLVIASRLLQIKSEALLPKPVVREAGEEDPGEALAEQLLVYKRFKEIADLMESRDELGLHTYLRLVSPPRPEPQLDLEGIDLSDLAGAMMEALASLPQQPDLNEVVAPAKIRIRDKVQDILRAIQHNGKANFREVLAHAESRLEIVVAFLAILELIKLKKIAARQDSIFGDIELHPGDRWGEDQGVEFELEFEE